MPVVGELRDGQPNDREFRRRLVHTFGFSEMGDQRHPGRGRFAVTGRNTWQVSMTSWSGSASRGSTSPTRSKRRARRREGAAVRRRRPGRLLRQPDRAAEAAQGPQVHPDRPRQLQRRHGPDYARPEPEGRKHAQGRRQRDGGPPQVPLAWRTSTPGTVVEQVEPLKKLLETRDKLRDLLTKVDRSEDLEKVLERVLQNTDELKKLSAAISASMRRRATRRRVNRWPQPKTAAQVTPDARRPSQPCSTRPSPPPSRPSRSRRGAPQDPDRGGAQGHRHLQQERHRHDQQSHRGDRRGDVQAARRDHAPPRVPEARGDLARACTTWS